MNSVFSVISRFFMNGNFVGDFFDPWVGSFELWLRAIEDMARLSGACGAGGGFFSSLGPSRVVFRAGTVGASVGIFVS